MKYFVFRIDELSRGSNGVTKKRCTLHRVVANKLTQSVSREYTFESDGQAAVNTALSAKWIKPVMQDNGDTSTSTSRYEACDVAKFMQV